MKLLKLTRLGYDIFINPKYVTAVTSGENGTSIYFIDKELNIVVQEKLTDVVELINNAIA